MLPSQAQITALTIAIAEGGLFESEIWEFVNSIGGIGNLQNIEEPSAKARQFIVDSNFVDLSESRYSLFGLIDLHDYVLARSIIYTELDESLNSRGSVYQTDFFAGAEDVTDTTGLTGGQFIASFTGGAYLYDLDALEDLQSIGFGLINDFNNPLYQALYYGDDSFILQTGRSLGQITRGSRRELNNAIVHEEQTYVQNQIDNLPADRRESLIRQSNDVLNGRTDAPVPQEIKYVSEQLGRDIDFGNQSDREAIGRATVDLAARTRANRENRPPPPPCRIITSAGGCD